MTKWIIKKANVEKEWEAYEDGTRGSFNQYIAKAFMVADENNEEKLANAFPEIAKIYRHWKYGDIEPFEIIVENTKGYICDKLFNPAKYKKDIKEYGILGGTIAIDNYTNRGKDSSKGNFSKITITNQNQYNDILKRYGIKEQIDE